MLKAGSNTATKNTQKTTGDEKKKPQPIETGKKSGFTSDGQSVKNGLKSDEQISLHGSSSTLFNIVITPPEAGSIAPPPSPRSPDFSPTVDLTSSGVNLTPEELPSQFTFHRKTF